MAINWILPVRGVQATLSCVVLGLMAYVASWWSTHWRQMSPVEVNFMIFSPVWSILALAALIVVPWKAPYAADGMKAKIGLLVLELLTTLYWFGGFIALAVFLNDRICFGTVCSVAKAGTAISALNWVAWMVTLVLGVVRVFFNKGASGAVTAPKVEMHQGV